MMEFHVLLLMKLSVTILIIQLSCVFIVPARSRNVWHFLQKRYVHSVKVDTHYNLTNVKSSEDDLDILAIALGVTIPYLL